MSNDAALQGAESLNSDQVTHHGPTSAEVVADIFALHFRGPHKVIDLTYGHGTFWRGDWWHDRVHLVTNDLHMPADHHEDFTQPFPPEWWADVAVFDPPFSSIGPASDGKGEWSHRYGSSRQNGGPKNVAGVVELMARGVEQAASITRHGLIIKTQNVIESGRLHDLEFVAKSEAYVRGFRLVDEVRLLSARRPQPDAARGAKVRHFRNRPSVFQVWRR